MRKKSEQEYKGSWSYRFRKWFDGRDLFLDNVEMKRQETREERPQDLERQRDERRELIQRVDDRADEQVSGFNRLYRFVAVLFCIFLAWMLLSAVSNLPTVGEADRPVNNEVYTRYVENGLEETGAVTAVTGMLLDYRAFDTLGETHVLFAATITVLILLRLDKKEEQEEQAAGDRRYLPRQDTVLELAAMVLVPFIIIFGLYVILCGHLGPGGGFSGGAIIGAGLMLFLNAYGFERTGKFLTSQLYLGTSFAALACYTLCKCYSFYTGANGMESVIGLGTPGAILSSGLIFVLNICVGVVVAGTMYTFYVMFRKGGY